MRWPWLVLLLLASVAVAQDDLWDDDAWEDDAWGEEDQGLVWSGFVEGGIGTRFDEDPLLSERTTLGELRARIETEWRPERFTLGMKADVGYDAVADEAIADFRDLTLAFRVGRNTDIKLGRQVQTWGTGDLLFLNDLFPKDFVSFFAGRDDEYLKAPGDAIRASWFGGSWNVDAVWTPVFEPDVYLTGERFSFFSPLAGGNVAPDPPLDALTPAKTLGNGEFALRVFRTVEGREYAIYGYSGWFKQPNALTSDLEATFAPLNAIGASLRQPLGRGLVNTEFAYYDSEDDRDGTDPLTPNSQLRLLAGYEWEALPRFTVGLQYYVEWTLDHDALVANSPFPQFEPDELRHVLTNRLTWRTKLDKLALSLFTFVSPSDRDFYLRPSLEYRYSDRWTATVGASLFGGRDDHTFFGQLQDASNAYLRLRFNY